MFLDVFFLNMVVFSWGGVEFLFFIKVGIIFSKYLVKFDSLVVVCIGVVWIFGFVVVFDIFLFLGLLLMFFFEMSYL